MNPWGVLFYTHVLDGDFLSLSAFICISKQIRGNHILI